MSDPCLYSHQSAAGVPTQKPSGPLVRRYDGDGEGNISIGFASDGGGAALNPGLCGCPGAG